MMKLGADTLHVGHLRSAIIGESIKSIGRFVGHKVIGDVHLGDWGLQMGLIITELKHRKPELVYFDDSYTGEYPGRSTIYDQRAGRDLSMCNGKSKRMKRTETKLWKQLIFFSRGKPGYMALWNHIMNVSVTDLKRNYDKSERSFLISGKRNPMHSHIFRIWLRR